MQVVGASRRLDPSHEGNGAALMKRDGSLLNMHQVVEGREREGVVFPDQRWMGMIPSPKSMLSSLTVKGWSWSRC